MPVGGALVVAHVDDQRPVLVRRRPLVIHVNLHGLYRRVRWQVVVEVDAEPLLVSEGISFVRVADPCGSPVAVVGLDIPEDIGVSECMPVVAAPAVLDVAGPGIARPGCAPHRNSRHHDNSATPQAQTPHGPVLSCMVCLLLHKSQAP